MTAAADRETLVQYVLGELSGDALDAVDERLFTDPELVEALGVVEDELIESYCSGALDASRRATFEARFLASDALRERVDLHRALFETLPKGEPAGAKAPADEPGRLASVIALEWLRRPFVLGLAAAAAVLLLTLVLRDGPVASPQRIALRASELRAATDSEVAVAALGRALDLELHIPVEESFTSYRLAVRRNDVTLFARTGERRDGQETVHLQIEGSRLPVGNYEIVLSAEDGGASQDLAIYSFVVREEKSTKSI